MHMCDMTHSYVWHDSSIWVTWLMHVCNMTRSYVWYNWLLCVTWLIHMCDMTCSYVWHDSSICVTWLIHKFNMTHPYGFCWYSFTYVTTCIYMADSTRSYTCGMTHSYLWHDSFICVTWHITQDASIYAYIYMCDMTHSYVWHDLFICVT